LSKASFEQLAGFGVASSPLSNAFAPAWSSGELATNTVNQAISKPANPASTTTLAEVI
jgi:hypothetical protein